MTDSRPGQSSVRQGGVRKPATPATRRRCTGWWASNCIPNTAPEVNFVAGSKIERGQATARVISMCLEPSWLKICANLVRCVVLVTSNFSR